RNAILGRKFAVELTDTRRKRTVCAGIVIVGHHVTNEPVRICLRWRTRWNWHGAQIARPEICQIAVFIGKGSVTLPSHPKVQRQPFIYLPVILEKRALVFQRIVMNNSVYRAAHAE